MMTNFHLNTTVVAIFPNVCLWRRSLCSDFVLTLKNRIEPPSYARTAYVVAIWLSFLFDSFAKIWATCVIFLGKWFTAPRGKKFPVRLWHVLRVQFPHGKNKRAKIQGKEREKSDNILGHLHKGQVQRSQSRVNLEKMRGFKEC